MKYSVEVFTCKNTKLPDKPNEDLVYFNEQMHLGLILDGVSRDREQGQYPKPSPAVEATLLFSEAVLSETMLEHCSGINRIEKFIKKGNNALREYNTILRHRFPAGVVGIVISIENGILNYGYIGDCYGMIIRNGTYRVFTECQTTMVAKHKKEFTTDEIRFNICNHINHPCGYGVWDGNSGAFDFVKYGAIHLSGGDVILLYTDGLHKEVKAHQAIELSRTPLDELFTIAPNEGEDDRTCLRIRVF